MRGASSAAAARSVVSSKTSSASSARGDVSGVLFVLPVSRAKKPSLAGVGAGAGAAGASASSSSSTTKLIVLSASERREPDEATLNSEPRVAAGASVASGASLCEKLLRSRTRRGGGGAAGTKEGASLVSSAIMWLPFAALCLTRVIRKSRRRSARNFAGIWSG